MSSGGGAVFSPLCWHIRPTRYCTYEGFRHWLTGTASPACRRRDAARTVQRPPIGCFADVLCGVPRTQRSFPICAASDTSGVRGDTSDERSSYSEAPRVRVRWYLSQVIGTECNACRHRRLRRRSAQLISPHRGRWSDPLAWRCW